jgi:hypothetical protein
MSSEGKWDVHKKNGRKPSQTPSPDQRAFDRCHYKTGYAPFLKLERAKDLKWVSWDATHLSLEVSRRLDNCIVNTRNLFRTFLQYQTPQDYRIGMALLGEMTYESRDEEKKRVLHNFEQVYHKQPVWADRKTKLFHVPGLEWKEINDTKILGRTVNAALTKLKEGVGCFEDLKTFAPQQEVLEATLELRRLIYGPSPPSEEDTDHSEN